MRIALVTRRFDPAGGGTERDLVVTARALAEAGHGVTIYAAETRAPVSEWRVRGVGGPPLGRASGLWWFARAAGARARRDGAEIVLSFARITDADILRSGGSAHVSYVQAARQWRGAVGALALRLGPYHRVQMTVERRGFTSPSLKKAIAVSNLVRDDLVRTFALAPAKVTTLYNGVDLQRFSLARNPAARLELRQALGIPDKAPVAVFAGNGFARKGLGFLLEAWPQIDVNARLLVAGNDRALPAYERLARRLGISGRVLFLGQQANVERLFQMADALALPSLFEPFGNVVMEAMAAGLPVLATTRCGVAEVMPGVMRPFLVEDPANPAEIATRLGHLLEARDGAIAAAARATAERFTWARYGEELNALIASLR
ncbi:MAG: glycosyltransferase family 4 protein [Candidatus Binataceae bacterium]